jgi:hypothetical protein
MEYNFNYVDGITQGFVAKAQGIATAEYSARGAVTLPKPFPFGRNSASDVLTIPGTNKRRIYSAVPYAYNGPDWKEVRRGAAARV